MSKPAKKQSKKMKNTKPADAQSTSVQSGTQAKPAGTSETQLAAGKPNTAVSNSTAVTASPPKPNPPAPNVKGQSRFLEIAFVVFVVAVLGIAALWYFKPWEPRHDGRTLSAWAEQLKSPDKNEREQAAKALVAIGASAVPKVEEVLRKFESKSKNKAHTSAVRAESAYVLGEMGSKAAKAIPTLVSALKSQRREVQIEAIRALGKIGTEDVIEPLIRLFEIPSPVVHQEAVNALAAVGEPALSRLREMLVERTPLTRMSVISVLAQIGEPAKDVVPDLIRAIERANTNARIAHAKWETAVLEKRKTLEPIYQRQEVVEQRIASLGKTAVVRIGLPNKSLVRPFISAVMEEPEKGKRNPGSLTELVTALGDDDLAVRNNASFILTAAKAFSVPDLRKGLKHDKPRVRANALRVLAEIDPKDENLASAVIPLVKDTDATVRANAAKALAKLSPEEPSAIKAITELLDDQEMYVRTGAVEALGHFNPDVPEVMTGLIKGLQDVELRVRLRAAETIGKLGPKAKAAVPVLAKRLNLEGIAGKYRIAAALSEIGADAKEATPALLVALRDGAALTRRYSAEALGKIGPVSDKVVPALTKALDDSEPPVVLAAVRSLGQIGGKASAAVSKLRELQTNQKVGPELQEAITKSLAQIQK